MTSTNRWVHCSLGHDHWGSRGRRRAAARPSSTVTAVPLCSSSTAPRGCTWATPGRYQVARCTSDEAAVDGALREVVEEAGLDLRGLATVLDTYVDDHGGWAYTTVLASAEAMFDPGLAADEQPSDDPAWTLPRERLEQERLAWWPVGHVTGLPLHPGFAATWPHVARVLDGLIAGPTG